MNTVSFTTTSKIEMLKVEFIDNYSPKRIVVCPVSGGLIVIKNPSFFMDVISTLINVRKISISSLLKLNSFKNAKEKTLKVIKLLFLKGIIVLDEHIFSTTSSSNNYKRMLAVNEKNRNLNLCVFHMHNYCNLGCKYCYLVNPKHKIQISLQTMMETVKKISQTQTRSINFEFHGGEPSMAFPLIRNFIKSIDQKYSDNFDKITYSIQSNGWNYKESDIEFMSEKKFAVRISLDGNQKNHDAYRVTKSGKGTYLKIISNIKIMNDYGILPEVCCVVHKNNLNELIDMFDNLASLGVSGIRFLPIFHVKNLSNDYYMNGKEFSEKVTELYAHAMKVHKNHLLTNLNNGEIHSLSSLTRNYMCMKSPCGAGQEMIGIDVDGETYPCEEMIGNKLFSLGNINSIDLNAIHKSSIMKSICSRNPKTLIKCSKCPWRELCQSGCPKKSFNKFHNLRSVSDMCEYYKNIFPSLSNIIFNSETESGMYESIITK